MKTIGINAIDVYVNDLAVVSEFYVEILGFTDIGPDGGGHMCMIGDLHIFFQAAENIMPGNNMVPVLQTESVKAMAEHLEKHNVDIEKYVEYNENFAMFSFVGPCGVEWSFAGNP